MTKEEIKDREMQLLELTGSFCAQQFQKIYKKW